MASLYQRYLGISTALLSAAGFIAISVWVSRQPLSVFDKIVLTELQSWQGTVLTAYFSAITWVGSRYTLIPLGLITLAWLIYRRWYRAVWFYSLGFAGASLIASLMKVVIDRPRPTVFPALHDMPMNASFPSGHATQITAYGLCLIILINYLRPQWRAAAAVALLLLAVSVCLSRTYLQLHYPTDVIGGMLLAIAWVLLMLWLFRHYQLDLSLRTT